jgi:predicted CXXCH cytochrome family protein
MRIRTAKTLAERIDLHYFKRARGLARWRYVLSAAAPVAVLLWVSALAASGNRTAYSPGPVSSAHAFAEERCEVCHAERDARGSQPVFRSHTTDAACLTCHDGPAHAANQTPAPTCAACHQEHRGRVQLARTGDQLCTGCHADLETTKGEPAVARHAGAFPSSHPEFAAVRTGARDPARVRFNHAVHVKPDLRGPNGPERLTCSTCHAPEAARAASGAKRPPRTGLMAPITYEQNCARCHPLFFDERLDRAVPHAEPALVRAFVRQVLTDYIRENPGALSQPDSAVRRVPLNFPRPPEPPARTAEEWIVRRAAADERLLWNKTCVECHDVQTAASGAAVPVYAPSNITRRWMLRAAFDHSPHLMMTCTSCHAADASTSTADVLLPAQAICASCHAPASRTPLRQSARAESRCFECHRYHDWTKARPVTPSYTLSDLK